MNYEKKDSTLCKIMQHCSVNFMQNAALLFRMKAQTLKRADWLTDKVRQSLTGCWLAYWSCGCLSTLRTRSPRAGTVQVFEPHHGGNSRIPEASGDIRVWLPTPAQRWWRGRALYIIEHHHSIMNSVKGIYMRSYNEYVRWQQLQLFAPFIVNVCV